MENKHFAAIDIGTNTILMLIANIIENKEFNVLFDEHKIARLGEGILQTKTIQPQAAERARVILSEYSNLCKNNGVTKFSAVGTSALRDAVNREEILKILNNAIGTEIQVIKGEEEAFLSFIGAIEDAQPSMVIDIGGGSTEIILGSGETISNKISLNMGAVKITERIFKSSQPPAVEAVKEASEYIQNQLRAVNNTVVVEKVYAVAGTPTTLAAIALELETYDDERVHLYRLPLQKIESIFTQFMEMNTQQIIDKFHIHPKRADVITAGTLILIEIIKYLKINEVIVNSHGLRYGVMKKLIKEEFNK